MLGAIIGDIIGSSYEFRNCRSKDFELFTGMTYPTDDTVMTLAVADVLQKGYIFDKEKIVETFKMWARAYPDSGYGGRFANWVFSNDSEPYYSMGNGAAMRISPVAWYAQSEEEVKDFAKRVTEVTHNHPDGLKGAMVVAMCIFYARKGKSKNFIKEYASKFYDLDFDFDDLRVNNVFDETCEGSIPQAIFCFLESNSYIDCIRNSVSIGGDSDTIAAIAGGIAEAYYKYIPEKVKNEALSYLRDEDPSPIEIVNNFLYEFEDDYLKSEKIYSNTIFIRVEEGNDVFVGHCKKILPIKNYIIKRLKEAMAPNLYDINVLLNESKSFDDLKEALKQINDSVLECDIKFLIYKK